MANHEKHIDDLLRDALGDYTEQPPAGAWADMEEKLDGGNTVIDAFFAEALSDYTETPPAGAWASMEAKLDGKTDFDHAFAEAFNDYSEVPPAGAWADMEARLDKEPRRRRGIIWLWSAAALSGLLAVGYYFMGSNENHNATSKTEIKIEAPVTTPVVNTPVSQVPVKAQGTTPVAALQNKQETVPQAPKEHTAVAHQPASQQDAPVAVEEKETAVQKTVQQAEPMPVVPKEIAVQNDSAKGTEKIDVDDIAAAIRRRANNIVMVVKRSHYADSVAEAEKIAQQKAEEEKAIQPEAPVALPEPVIAAKADTIIEIAKEEITVAPDTISALAKEAINETLKNMEVKQDAIASVPQQQQAEQAVFEMGALAGKAAESVTADGDKGSLQAYISPEAVVAAYYNTVNDSIVKVRTPISFDWFVKAGVESGLEKKTAGKFVLASAIHVNLTSKLSLMLQPAIKSGKVNYSQVNAGESYHDIKSSYVDSLKTFSITHNSQGIIFDSIKSSYFYQQTYDSLVASHSLSTRSIIEAELPIMLNYKVGNNFSVYGGPVITYSTMLNIKEDITNYGSKTLRDTVRYGVRSLAGTGDVPPAPSIGEVFQYSTPNISQYNNAPYANSTVNKIRMGYMLGASYSYKRISADITVQQNLSRMNYIINPGVRSIYLQPYMRLMLGYKLNGKK